MRKKQYQEAEKLLAILKKECESDFDLTEFELEITMNSKDLPKVKKIYKSNEYDLKMYKQEMMYLLQAQTQKYENLREKMMKTLEKGIKEFPKFEKLKAMQKKEKELQLKFQTGQNYHQERKYTKAIQTFQEII